MTGTAMLMALEEDRAAIHARLREPVAEEYTADVINLRDQLGILVSLKLIDFCLSSSGKSRR
jgi:hypothetical protein